MKPGIRPRRQNLLDMWTGQAETDKAACDIYPVCTAKFLDQRITSVRRNLVVLQNHLCDFASPRCLTCGGQMSPSQRDRRRNIVERVIRPNTEVMKSRGNRNFLQMRAAVG